MRGIYSATSIMLASLDYQGLIAKNLANANTPGYKAERARMDDFGHLLLELNGDDGDPLGLGVVATEALLDLNQGPLRSTERALDLAISGTAFFSVQTAEGTRLTRDGSFGLNAARQLVTSDGHLVLGTAGPITLPEGEVSIAEDGRVFVNGTAAGQLALAVVEDPARLAKAGGNLFEGAGRLATAGEATVLQGYLEGSNVDIAGDMSHMMAIYRTYEAAQRIILMQSQTMDAATTQVGQV